MRLQTISIICMTSLLFKTSKPAYYTKQGDAYSVDSRRLLQELPNESVNLVITSPPNEAKFCVSAYNLIRPDFSFGHS